MTRLRGKACGGHGEKSGLESIVKPAYPRMGWLRPLIALSVVALLLKFFINGGCCLLCFVLRSVFYHCWAIFEIILFLSWVLGFLGDGF